MRVLLFGASGQVGKELCKRAGGHDWMALTRVQCDLRDPESIRRAIRERAPAMILNASGYTAVDKAETQVEECFAVNATAPRIMAEEAARLNALLVHYSTEYVFDGDSPSPYKENDLVNPQNQYGRSKLEGERGIQESGATHLIFRVSWIFSAHGSNFVKTMLRLAGERDSLRIVNDQIGAPTSAAAIAEATLRIIDSRSNSLPSGLYHLAAEGEVSWYGFAQQIFSRAALARTPAIEAIDSSQYPTSAHRPKNSRLCKDKFVGTFGFRLSSWQEQLEEVLCELGCCRTDGKAQEAHHQD